MANTDLTVVQITREALRAFHNNCVFAKNANKEYSSEFAKAGAKIGATANVRMPPKYYVTKSANLQAQNFTETNVPVTITTQWQVGLKFTQQELTLSLDDFSKRVINPAMAKLATSVDMDGLVLAKDVYNQVGTAGTTPGTAGGSGLAVSTTPQIYLNSGALLDSNAVPRDENRRIVLEPFAMANSVAGLSGLFQDSGKLAEQYSKGVLGKALGFDFASDQNVCRLTTGTHSYAAASLQVSTAGQTGASLITRGWSAASETVLKKGEVFTIAGVYGVNPENQQSTGQLQQFVVTDDATSASSVPATTGAGSTLSISPSIVVAGTGVANGTVTAAPANNAAITILTGSGSTDYPLSLAYHKDAFTLATVDLEMPRGVDMAHRESYDGISMLIVRAYDINTSNFPCRVDILGGWKTLRPEMACRIIG